MKIFCTYFRAYSYLGSKHAVLGSHLLLVVIEPEEDVVALHLLVELVKARSGLQPVPR